MIERGTFTLNVAASVIADISAGIYRTPAGALKELISNAFDADAATVRLTSGSPHFETFTCTDDGCGMSALEFKELMGLIGGSTKRDKGDETPKYKRPLIGRIGIGLLSIAQICRRFEVFSSKAGERHKFRARVDLDPFMSPEARRKKLGDRLTADARIRIGECQLETAAEETGKHYTRIVMESVLPGFREQLKGAPMIAAGTTPRKFKAGDMLAFYKSVSRGDVAAHGAYAKLIWELATTAPISYLADGPIRGAEELDDIRRRLENYQFHVFFDGVELQKPVLLPRGMDVEHRVYPRLLLDKQLANGRRLVVRGYLYWQKRRILPRELQGILVRVRNVGIGIFDATFLGYPRHEGWKFSQLCGELYVDDGLDEALNIDRASFRETDEAYLELQEFLFGRLGRGTDEGAGIFTDIKARTKASAARKKEAETRQRRKRVARVVYGKAASVDFSTGRTPSGSGVDVTRGAVVVSEELALKVPKRARELFLNVCGLFERELEGKLAAQKRRDLYARLADLFSLQ